MTRSQGNKIARTAAVVLLPLAVIEAAEFEITRSTIDGGGVMRSTGGAFELSGTIGQPDAGTMSGGAFELNGGFWFALDPGDCNEDGIVSLPDHAAFQGCLAGPGVSMSPSCRCHDLNGDGTIDLADFAELQNLLNME